MRRKTRQHQEIPRLPIEPILKELGMTDVPTGFGWVRCSCFASDSHANGDRSRSAAVNHEKQAYVCHGCGRKGDAIALLQSELGLSFLEALERAKHLCGVSGTEPVMNKRRRPSDLLRGG